MTSSQATGSDEPGPSSHPLVDEVMHDLEEEELVDYELSDPDEEEPVGVPSSAAEQIPEGADQLPTPVQQASDSHSLTDTVHSLISEVNTLRSAADAVSSLTEMVQELRRDVIALGKRKAPEDTGVARPAGRGQNKVIEMVFELQIIRTGLRFQKISLCLNQVPTFLQRLVQEPNQRQRQLSPRFSLQLGLVLLCLKGLHRMQEGLHISHLTLR